MPEATASIPEIQSPCIGVCSLDRGGVCVGCFRTAGEIAAWLGYTPQQRSAIIAELPGRAQAYPDD